MKFLKYPESVTAPVGDKVTFECEVNVPAEWLTWRWRPGDNPGMKWTDVEKSAERDFHSPTATNTRLVVHIKEDTETAVFQVSAIPFSNKRYRRNEEHT